MEKMTREEIKESILGQISCNYIDFGMHEEEVLDYIKEVVSSYDELKKEDEKLKVYLKPENIVNKINDLERNYCNRTDCVGRIKDSTKYDSLLQENERLKKENEELKELQCSFLGTGCKNKMEDLQRKAELGEHYKHLYSEIKKQKDDVVEYIKSLRIFSARNNGKTLFAKILNEILRLLGEEE